MVPVEKFLRSGALKMSRTFADVRQPRQLMGFARRLRQFRGCCQGLLSERAKFLTNGLQVVHEAAWRQPLILSSERAALLLIRDDDALACRAEQLGGARPLWRLTFRAPEGARRWPQPAGRSAPTVGRDENGRRPAAPPRAARRWQPSRPPAAPAPTPSPTAQQQRRSPRAPGCRASCPDPADRGPARRPADCCRLSPADRLCPAAADQLREGTCLRAAARPLLPAQLAGVLL